MTQHTPGPWYAVQFEKNARYQIVNQAARLSQSGARFIAELRGPLWPGVPQGPEIDANANLIAAAPDLLAALKAVVELSDRKHDAWDAAKAAIAKAEGRA